MGEFETLRKHTRSDEIHARNKRIKDFVTEIIKPWPVARLSRPNKST